MGSAALGNDREVLLVLFNFSPHCIEMNLFHVKSHFYERLYCLLFGK